MPPKLFSFSAIIVGYLLIDDMTANEQNAVGNWLMLVAQVLSTNAFYRQVMQERGLEPENSTEHGATRKEKETSSSQDQQQTIAMLEKIIIALQTEIEQIKKQL